MFEGQEAVLPCLITDPKLEPGVSLVRAGGKPVRRAYSFSPQRGFIIRKVKFIDGRDYQCKAVVDGRESLSIGIRLEVHQGRQDGKKPVQAWRQEGELATMGVGWGWGMGGGRVGEGVEGAERSGETILSLLSTTLFSPGQVG